jgi:Tol biopolymer transport system component
MRFKNQIFMAKINSVKSLIKNSIVLFSLVLLTHSCKIKDDSINPADYELYISISSDKYPSVSPDGTLIAYYHKSLVYPEPSGNPTGLYVMNMDGTNKRLMLKGEHWTPRWSPDGQWLTFSSNGTIEIIKIDGDSIRTCQGINDVPLFYPDWSKNGKMILMNSPYVNGGGVFISDLQFKFVRQLFDQTKFSGFSAQWVPDMSKIIYEKVSHEWAGGEIFIMDTLGINDSRITNDNLDDRNPTLSNNGNLITWSRNMRIMVMNVNGTKQKTLDYGQFPSWSPNSDYIIYSNANSDRTKEVLWKINFDGTNKTQLTY